MGGMLTLAEARAAMERAMEHARTGQHEKAQTTAWALVAEHPRDLNLLHQAGKVMLLGSAHEDALGLFEAALERNPNFHYTEMEIANTFLAMRRPEDAVWWYQKAARSAPAYAPAYRRAGQIMGLIGRNAQALELLRQANTIDPTEPETAAALASQLVFHNLREEAADAYARVAAVGRMRETDLPSYASLLTELGRYDQVVAMTSRLPDNIRTSSGYEMAVLAGNAALATRLNRAALAAAATTRQQSPRWLDTPGVIAAIRAAISDRRPFSLIRLGDGEARFLAHCDPDLRGRLSPAQIEVLGDVPFRNWFRQAIAEADPIEVSRLAAATITAVEQADILGVSTDERLTTDNSHFGYFGHLEGLIDNIVRTEARMRLTDALIHIDLHRASPFYRDVLAGLDFLGVISPHAGLAKRLGELHGIPYLAEFVLPGVSPLSTEQFARHTRPQFPDIYHELCRNMRVTRPGAVFLVAGGQLTTIYCNIIRQLGGIGLDVGCVFDGWIGPQHLPNPSLEKTGPKEAGRYDIGV